MLSHHTPRESRDTQVYLARQPIFDQALKVYGYELLYRSSASNGYDASDGAVASMQVLSSSLLALIRR